MEIDELMEQIDDAAKVGNVRLVQTLCQDHKNQTQKAITIARAQRDRAQALLERSVSPREIEQAREIYKQADETLQSYIEEFRNSATYVADMIHVAITNSRK